MYDTLKSISYPFTNLQQQNLPAEVYAAVKQCIVDFRLQVHYDGAPFMHPVVTVTHLSASGGNVRLGFTVLNPLTEGLLAGTGSSFLELAPTAPASEDLIRYHFETSDLTALDPAAVALGVHVEGMITTDALTKLAVALAPFSPFIFSGLVIEPATTSVFHLHKVQSIRCRTAKPLLLQTTSDRYFQETAEVAGHVKLIAGDNCVISLQPVSNTIVISPQREANDSQSERCGAWSQPISDKDVLCGDVIYGISGAAPDSEGNVQIRADSPVYVGTLSRQDLLDKVPDFAAPLNDVPAEVEWFVYVGLPAGPNNASVFDCEGV